jgi:hypothetical protein
VTSQDVSKMEQSPRFSTRIMGSSLLLLMIAASATLSLDIALYRRVRSLESQLSWMPGVGKTSLGELSGLTVDDSSWNAVRNASGDEGRQIGGVADDLTLLFPLSSKATEGSL